MEKIKFSLNYGFVQRDDFSEMVIVERLKVLLSVQQDLNKYSKMTDRKFNFKPQNKKLSM